MADIKTFGARVRTLAALTLACVVSLVGVAAAAEPRPFPTWRYALWCCPVHRARRR